MKYFGTDGIRGIYGEGITEDVAYRAGRALAYLFGGTGIVGRDTRVSGPGLEEALCAGLTDGGADAVTVGIATTPEVAYLARCAGAAFGVSLSASHNPPEYNGIKIFSGSGSKLSVSAEEALEYYMDNVPHRTGGGTRSSDPSAGEKYRGSLEKAASDLGAAAGGSGRLDGLRVLLDCGAGAAAPVAAEAFMRLGAAVSELCSECRGECINVRCGALHPSAMATEAERRGCDIGLSFDGDADRLVVWRRGLMAGDEVMYNLSRFFPAGSAVVGTVLSNSALERAVQSRGGRFVRTGVGDRSVSEVMRITGAPFGGEPSGHFVLRGGTGDGILSGIACCILLLTGGLYSLELDRQAAVDVPADAGVLTSPALTAAVEKARRLAGRVVVRMSGTEPVLRIMAEGGDAEGAAALVAAAVK